MRACNGTVALTVDSEEARVEAAYELPLRCRHRLASLVMMQQRLHQTIQKSMGATSELECGILNGYAQLAPQQRAAQPACR